MRSTGFDSRTATSATGSDIAGIGDHPAFRHLASLMPMADPSSVDTPRPHDLPTDIILADRLQTITSNTARCLHRHERRHVILTNKPGTGRTAALCAFAQVSRQGCFPFLTQHHLIYIDAANVGPEDTRACLETIFALVTESQQKIVLLCDGFTSLIPRPHGGNNIPLLLSLMNNPAISIVATASPWEYNEFVGQNAKLLRMMQRIELSEPDAAECRTIISRVIEELSDQFDVVFDADIAARTVELSSIFMMAEAQPAKSVRLIRQLCDDVVFRQTQQNQPASRIGVADLAQVISEETDIPVRTILGDTAAANYREILQSAVVGQEPAIDEVASELDLIAAGLKDSAHPASVMLFCGTTGVGKTELARQLARVYSSSGTLHTYCMGNFTEQHSVSGINGVPPGYVGYEQGGRLINELLSDPYSVFLLDEAEKCHPNVWKPFLTLFDEGWIVDQRGVKAYADRAIFILTTNAGDRGISQLCTSGKSRTEIVDHVRRTLSRIRHERSSQPVFPPAFLARLHRIIVFDPLSHQAMLGIAERLVERMSKRWQKARSRNLIIAPDALARIAEKASELNDASNGQEGGRIVRKLLSELVERRILEAANESADNYASCRTVRVEGATTQDRFGVSFE